MKKRTQICLTELTNRGYLFLLVHISSMGLNNQALSPSLTSEDIPSERNAETTSRGLLQRLRALAGSSRARIGAALLGAVGAVETANKAEGAIMRPAEILHSSQATEVGDDEYLFGWEGLQFRFTNDEDQSNRDVHWVGIRSMDETEADAALPIPGHLPEPGIIGPNEIPGDGITSPEVILNGQLQVREDFFVAIGVDENGNTLLGVDELLENSEFYVGLSPIQGNAQNIDDALAMTDGVVYKGTAPAHLESSTAYVIRPTGVPEPSTAVLGGLAAGGAATGLRRWRKSK